MLSTPRRALLAAMEMDTKVQGQKAAAAATPSWRAPDKLAAALALLADAKSRFARNYYGRPRR